MGLDPNTPDLTDEQAISLTEFINTAVRRVWEHAHFPETILVEERHYRDDWNAATAYAIADEVWLPAQEKYYTALTANTNKDPATELTDWEESTDLRKYLPFSQIGKTDVDALINAYQKDPRIITAPEKLYFKKTSDGYQFGRFAPDAVFIEYRAPAPQFTSSEYSAATQYAANALAYVPTTGECYKALVDTEGNDPTTSSDEWVKVDFPYFASDVVKEYAYSSLLIEDGEFSKADKIRQNAEDLLIELEIIELEQQGQNERFSVRGI